MDRWVPWCNGTSIVRHIYMKDLSRDRFGSVQACLDMK